MGQARRSTDPEDSAPGLHVKVEKWPAQKMCQMPRAGCTSADLSYRLPHCSLTSAAPQRS